MAAKNIIEMLNETVSKFPDYPAVSSKKDGVWRDKSWREVQDIAHKLSGGLMSLGLEAGERAAIIANTREEWFFTDLAIVHSGGITVPIYPSNLPDECAYILNHSGASMIFVENNEQLQKILQVKGNLPNLREIIIIDDDGGKHEGVINLDELAEKGEKFLSTHKNIIKERVDILDEDTPLTIIYTSGTTGPPKGVVLTHRVFTKGAPMIINSYPLSREDTQLLFLPMAHSFAKMLMYCVIPLGPKTVFAESIEKLVENISETNPAWMGAVPRIYEKIYQKAMAGAEEAGGLKYKIFSWASEIAVKKSKLEQAGDYMPFLLKIQHSIADKLVYSKIRALFGSNFRFSVSGGAPLSTDIAHWFAGAGVKICEGYGLTETNSITSANRPDHIKIGTVGPPWEGIEAKIAEDGELLLKGASNMKEYYKDPDATAETLVDGWLHTGDIAEIDKEGFIKITDRKKDIIVTAGGKNIAPQNIENLIKTSPFISQVMVYGDKRKFLTCLVTCDEDYIKSWAEREGMGKKEMKELVKDQRLIDAVDAEIKRFNSQLPSYSTIKRFRILPVDFSQDTGELTPSLKVKRKFVTKKYWDLLEEMYADVR